MNNKLKILLLIAVMGLLASSCTYEELPPKTDDVSKDFILPKGEVPTSAELQQLYHIKEQYKNRNN